VGSERTLSNRERHGNDTVGRRLSVEDADVVGQVIEDGQIVLDGDDVGGRGEDGTDDSGSIETLLDVEVGGGLVEHVATERKHDMWFRSASNPESQSGRRNTKRKGIGKRKVGLTRQPAGSYSGRWRTSGALHPRAW
jgi:hypothetical protein